MQIMSSIESLEQKGHLKNHCVTSSPRQPIYPTQGTAFLEVQLCNPCNVLDNKKVESIIS